MKKSAFRMMSVRGAEPLKRFLLCGIPSDFARSAETENSGMPMQPLQILLKNGTA